MLDQYKMKKKCRERRGNLELPLKMRKNTEDPQTGAPTQNNVALTEMSQE